MFASTLVLLALVPAVTAITVQPLDHLLGAATLPKAIYGHFHNILLTKARTEAKLSTKAKPLSHSSVSYLSAGYVYLQLSDLAGDNTCQKASMQLGIPVNTCIVADKSSYMIKLATDSCADASLFIYEDATCTKGSDSYALDDLAETCNPYTGETALAYGGVTGTVPIKYWQLHCTAQPTKPIVVDSAIVELFSDKATCSNYVGFMSIAPDLCFPVGNGAFSLAVRCDTQGTVSMVEFLGGTCGLAFGGIPYAPTCTAVSDASPLARTAPRAAPERRLKHNRGGNGGTQEPEDPESDPEEGPEEDPEEDPDESSTEDPEEDSGEESAEDTGSGAKEDQLGLVGMMTSTNMAAFKTECGHSNVNYAAIMAATQTLSGVNIASYLANVDAFTAVLQRAIADSIGSGVQAADVYISSVLAYVKASGSATTGASHAGSLRAPQKEAQSTPAISVSYTVMPYGVSLQNEDLSSLLSDAVDSGVFDTLLHQIASSQGVPALSGARSAGVSVNPLTGTGGTETGTGGGGGGTGTGTGGGDTTTDDSQESSSSGTDSTDSTKANEGLPLTAIIGITAGGALLLIIVASGYWYLSHNAVSTTADGATPTQDNITMVEVTPRGLSAAPSAPVQMCSVNALPEKGDLVVASAPTAVAYVTARNVTAYV